MANKVLATVFNAVSVISSTLGIGVSIYLFVRWGRLSDTGVKPDFNPWIPGLVLFALAAVFRYAAKGAAPSETPAPDDQTKP